MDYSNWQRKANLIRKWSLISTTEAGSGHPTSSMSAADLCTVLFDKYYAFDLKNPENKTNDRFILSKGHASPLLYSLYAVAGAYPLEELKTLRKFGSRFEGHPTPRFPYVDVTTGSLGQGLSIGAGMALSAKKDLLSFKTYVLLGDGECAEGSVWEAANFSSFYRLNNLIAIVDVNRLGQSQETMFGHNLEEYVQRFSAFDWEAVAIDGHNFEEIDRAFKLATENKSENPFVIIAKTKKGKGVSFLEDKDGWHGKAIKKEDLDKAISELGSPDDSSRFQLKTPPRLGIEDKVVPNNLPGMFEYTIGDEIATRDIYGKVLGKLADSNPSIFSLDGDTKNSTFSQDFKQVHPERFIECFIAEQNMVGVATGLAARGKIPFVSTFAAFLTRAFDQIRMAAVSKVKMKFVGSHAGVSIGEDGPSQMGLEDMAMFGALPGSIIFHPSDATSTAKIIPLLVEYNEIGYLRTLRPKTPVIYSTEEKFAIGGSKVLKQSQEDVLTVVSCGITVFEAMKAHDLLQKEGISVRLIDCYSIKPIDKKTLKEALLQTKQKVMITVEDHFEHGGLGDFVLSALCDTGATIEKLAVKDISESGTKDELLDLAGISSKHIVQAVKKYLK